MRLILFSLAVFGLGGCLNLYRSTLAWRQLDVLEKSTAQYPLQQLVVTSLIWGLIFIVCGFGLWRRKRWGWRWTPILTSLYHVHIWVNHVLFDTSDYARQIWPFALANSGLVLLFVWGFLYLPSIRAAYRQEPTKGVDQKGELL